MHNFQNLSRLFEPEVVAIIGASSNPEKRGYQILRSLVDGGFEGTVVPVNPKGGSILGLRVVTSIEEMHPVPDLAVLALPAEAVGEAVEQAATKGVGAVVVLAVGFAESGLLEGMAREAHLADVVARTGIRIVGPNTSGVLNAHRGLNVIGTPGVGSGPIAVVTQSGNLALHLLRAITSSGSGVSICIGVGNQVDVGFAEAVEFLHAHEQTQAIVVYAEGFRDGPRFLSVCAMATPNCPVLVLKSGRTEAGQRAALSHSGAIAGPHAVLAAALAQAGVTVIEREDELTPVALTLANQPADARGVAMLSDGGGQGTLASDALTAAGTTIATLSDETRAALSELLGEAAAVQNPVDLAGRADADPGVFAEAMKILVDDDAVGSVLVIGLFGGYHLRFAASLVKREMVAARRMTEAAKAAGKGFVVHTMFAHEQSQPLERLRKASVPVVGSLEVACAAISALQRRGQFKADPPHPIRSCAGPVERVQGPPVQLGEWEARTFLDALPGLDVPMVEAVRCATESEVAQAAAEFPAVVLKADVSGLAHKTEHEGVVLDVPQAQATVQARQLLDRMTDHASPATPVFVLVQPMLAKPLAELILAVRFEPQVGVVATVGAGGVWTEALGDVAHVLLPCRDGAIRDAVRGLKCAPLLFGGRGGSPVSTQTLVALESLARDLGQQMQSRPHLLEIEINPLFVYPDRLVAADALIVRVDSGCEPGVA